MNEENDDSKTNLFDILQGGPTGNPYEVRVTKDESGHRIWLLAEPEKIYFNQPLCNGSIEDELETAIQDIDNAIVAISAIDLYIRPRMIKGFSSDSTAPFVTALDLLCGFPRVRIVIEIRFGTGMLFNKAKSDTPNDCERIYANCREPVDKLVKAVGAKLSATCKLYPDAAQELIRFNTAFRGLERLLVADTAQDKISKARTDCIERLKDASAALFEAALKKPRKRHPKTGKRVKYDGMMSCAILARELTKVGACTVRRSVNDKVIEERVFGVMKSATLRKIESRYKTIDCLEPRFQYCQAFRLNPDFKTRLRESIDAWRQYSHSRANALERYIGEHPHSRLSSYRPMKKVVLVRDGDIERRTRAEARQSYIDQHS